MGGQKGDWHEHEERFFQSSGMVPVIVLQQPTHHRLSVSTSMDNKNTIVPVESKLDGSPASATEMELREPTSRNEGSSAVGVVQQWELPAKRQLPRIAVNAKGRIFFIEVAEIVAVHSQGNYASLRCQSSLYLLRESLGSIAVKLKPYGFIQIHRSVLVNAVLVDEVWPLSTGEYGLRLRNGGEYVVTRRYRDNLKHLAYVWLGSGRIFSPAPVE